MTKHEKRPVLGWTLLILLQLAIAGVCSYGFATFSSQGWQFSIVYGLALAQMSLVAVLGALGTQRLMSRVLGSVLLALVPLIAMLFPTFFEPFWVIWIIIGGPMVSQWLGTWALFGSVRITGRCVSREGGDLSDAIGDHQYGMKQMLIWTAMIAAILGAGRLVVGGFDGAVGDTQDLVRIIPAFAVLSFASILMVGPAIWAMFVQQSVWRWLFAASVFTIGVTGGELLVLNALDEVSDDSVWAVSLLNLVHVSWVALTLSIVRMWGYRLRRVPNSVGLSREVALGKKEQHLPV